MSRICRSNGADTGGPLQRAERKNGRSTTAKEEGSGVHGEGRLYQDDVGLRWRH